MVILQYCLQLTQCKDVFFFLVAPITRFETQCCYAEGNGNISNLKFFFLSTDIYHCIFGNLEESLQGCCRTALETASKKEFTNIIFWVDGFASLSGTRTYTPHSPSHARSFVTLNTRAPYRHDIITMTIGILFQED